MRALWLLVLVSLSACTKPDRPYVDRLKLDEVEGLDVLGQTKADVLAELKRQLNATGFVVLEDDAELPKGVKPWRVSAALAAQEPKIDGDAEGRVAIALSLKQLGGSAFDVSARARKKPASQLIDDFQVAARAALVEAATQAASEARGLIQLERATDAALVEKLADRDSGTREAALKWLAVRKHKAALPAIVGRLNTESDDELRRVMGLLVELGDPAGAKPLIDATGRKNLVMQREVVFALGAIGGDEAEAYLNVVAEGHDDEHLREWAKQALDEMKTAKRARK